MTDLRASAQLENPISHSSMSVPMEIYIEEIAEIFTQDWFEFEDDCIADISDPIIELHNEMILVNHEKEELDHIMNTSEDDMTNFVRCELDKLRTSIFEQLTLDPTQLSFERTKSLESLDAMMTQGDSGKTKKKKKGFFGTLRLTRTASREDDETSPTASPNEKDKKGFTSKLKNLFKFKRKTSPKPSRKNAAAESGESESEDFDSDSEEHKDH